MWHTFVFAGKTSSVMIIVAIGASTAVVLVLLLSIGFYLLRRRARDKYMNTIHLHNGKQWKKRRSLIKLFCFFFFFNIDQII